MITRNGPAPRQVCWLRKISLSLVLLTLLSSIVFLSKASSPSSVAHAAAAVSLTSLSTLLARNTSVMTSPPTATPSAHVPDGPLMGNGHMTAVVGGTAEAQTYYINATDFWKDNVPKTIGGVTVSIPALAGTGTNYKQEQDIGNAEVRSTFTTSASTIKLRSWISANEDTMVLSVTNASGAATPSVTVKTYTGSQDNLPTTAGLLASGPNTMWATRTTNSQTWLSNAALATRILNDSSVTYSSDNTSSASGTFTLNPGQTVEIATVLKASGGNVSGTPQPAPVPLTTELTNAQARVAMLNARKTGANSVLDDNDLHNDHLKWWQNFWKSGATIDLGGDIVERYWYTSLYAMAASNRAGFSAPGMQGFQTNDNPDWLGDWTTDYDFEMPYQGLYAANHVELTTPYEQGVMDYVPLAQSLATANGFQGVYFPNAIATGGQTTYGSPLGMKGNAAWLATNFALHWNYTHDTTWAQKVGYPYLIQLANFWDNDLTKDANGVYNIHNSAQNETSSYQLNPIGDLAWLHYEYPVLISMSEALNVDASRRAKWQDIIANLAPYPTFTTNGHTDFKATQDAPGFYGGDANPVNAIFPGNNIGLGSSPATIQTAQHTIEDLNVWSQGNSFGWVFPAAARVGLPDTYNQLSYYLSGGYGSAQPGARGNTTVYQWGGGAETFGGMETVNSILLSSYDGVLRLFPDLPISHDASFTNMLANGAFTVSSSIKDGIVQRTTLTSQKGGTATIDSPWSPGTIKVTDNTDDGSKVKTTTNGNLVSFTTKRGHTYHLSGTGHHSYVPLNLARTATASASSSHEGNDWSLKNVNDGQEKSTEASKGWSSADANASSNHTEWVQLDMGTPLSFSEVDLYPRDDGANAGYGFPLDFTIAVSNDGSSWTPVVTETGYALPKGVQKFTFASQTARYVRVTGTNLRPSRKDNDNDKHLTQLTKKDSDKYLMQLAEIEIYDTDLARAATTSASSSHEGSGWSVKNINDGVLNSTSASQGWSSGDANTASNHTEWVQVNLGASQAFHEVDLYPRDDGANAGYGFPIDFTIAVSNDGSNWTTVVTKTGYALPTGVQSFTFASQNVQYVQVTGTNLRPNPNDSNGYRMQFAEIALS